MPEYNRDQLWKLYEELPADLKEAIFSVDTADDILFACTKNEIGEEKISDIAKYTGYVLLGVLPPGEFQAILEKEVGLDKTVAKKVDHDINRFVFWPVKDSLTAIYKTEIVVPEKAQEIITEKETPRKERAKRKDVYREPVE